MTMKRDFEYMKACMKAGNRTIVYLHIAYKKLTPCEFSLTKEQRTSDESEVSHYTWSLHIYGTKGVYCKCKTLSLREVCTIRGYAQVGVGYGMYKSGEGGSRSPVGLKFHLPEHVPS